MALVGEVGDYERAAVAALVAGRLKHMVVYDELRLAVEEVLERDGFASRAFKRVRLCNWDHRELAALFHDFLGKAVVFVFFFEKGKASCAPFICCYGLQPCKWIGQIIVLGV